jgi:hypothetical protein
VQHQQPVQLRLTGHLRLQDAKGQCGPNGSANRALAHQHELMMIELNASFMAAAVADHDRLS